ncbi:MAG: hypothetical protein ACI89X_005045 [Planctomycetota bacterium]|jgi:hypothetical protein
MLCSRANLLRVATMGCAMLVAAAHLQSQRPTAKPRQPAITAIVRDPSSAKVHDAKGWLLTEPAWRLAALGSDDLPLLATGSPMSQQIAATSDARGVLRFPIPAGSMAAAGSGMVTTAAGLGALLPRLHAKRAPLITLEPMALVTTATGSESFVLIARATLADGSKITLPPQRGSRVRLPAGDYEVWACGRDGLIWQRLQLQPGQRSELQFVGAVQRMQLAKGAYVHPAGLPSLSLQQFAGEDFGGEVNEVALRGAALAAPWITWSNGIVTPARVVPGPPTHQARMWPPKSDLRERAASFRLAATAHPGTVLVGLLRKSDRSFGVVAYANNDAGQLHMPAAPSGDAWLLLLAPGHAPHAQPWSTTADGLKLRSPTGQLLAVTARDRRSLPIADLVVSYTPERQDAAALIARTDATGVARFGRVVGPGTLQISDERYANQDVRLQRVPSDPLPLVIDDGETLNATVKFADGADGTAIVVTLRDPSDELRPRERSLVASVGTTFSFYGLPSEHNLLLIATAQRKGKTWSARRVVNALDEDVVITLRDEDPVLRGNGR